MRIKFYGQQGSKVDCLLGSVKDWTEVSFWRYIWLICGEYCSKVELIKGRGLK